MLNKLNLNLVECEKEVKGAGTHETIIYGIIRFYPTSIRVNGKKRVYPNALQV